MMRIENLMVGDWVKLNYDINFKTGELIYTNVRITGINEDGSVDVLMQDGDGWDLKLIYPILLTEDVCDKIFTKGSGNYKEGYYIGHWEEQDIYLSFNPIGKYIEAFRDGGEPMQVCPCTSVHELQHFIKCFNFDKEISL